MADFLAEQRRFMDWLTDPVRQHCKETAYEHVTRNVTVALCVTGLVVTWGTARERGNREEDDLVLDCCELDEVSAIADIPCFGEAMAHVGWAAQREDDCVVFPKFFKEQESPDDRHKRQNAERQATFRDRHKANGRNGEVTQKRNVTVTHREEKRRDKKQDAPPDGGSSIWDFGKTLLAEQGLSKSSAGALIGSWLRDWSEPAVADALRSAAGKADARAYVQAVLNSKPKKSAGPVEKQVAMP